jgi:RNA polymerase sigma-70 factor (family 1)
MAIVMMPLKHDSYLLEKLKQGDEDAFNAFFKKYYKLLFANALFYTRDEQEAKDVVQDFLFEFWEKKLFLRLEGDMKGYLYRSVQHKCYNLQRKKSLHHQDFLLSGYQEADREEIDEREERFVQLEEALDDLPPQRREVIKRIYLENKKYQDAADEIGITLNTLKTHLKIGLKNLREKLK